MRPRIQIEYLGRNSDAPRRNAASTVIRVFLYTALGVFGIVLTGLYGVGVYACYILGQRTFSPAWNQIADVDAAKTFFPALIALIGGPLLIWRVITSQLQATAARHQVQISRQAHYTDIFAKAIEQLGATRPIDEASTKSRAGHEKRSDATPNIEVRLGAIFALEQIARDSERDYWPVMEVLCAYLRSKENTGDFVPLRPNEDVHRWLDGVPSPRLDVQAVITVLGRRSKGKLHQERGERMLDLTGAILQRASFEYGDFTGIDLSDAHLENARFSEASLQHIEFNGAHLQHARFYGAKLDAVSFQHADLLGVQFAKAKLNHVLFYYTKLRRAEFDWARLADVTVLANVDLTRATLFDADLSQVDFQDEDALSGSLGDNTTKLPHGSKPPTTWPARQLTGEERNLWIRENKPPNDPRKQPALNQGIP